MAVVAILACWSPGRHQLECLVLWHVDAVHQDVAPGIFPDGEIVAQAEEMPVWWRLLCFTSEPDCGGDVAWGAGVTP